MEEGKEKNIDIKNTMAKMLKEENPEMTQEEAIMNYKEKPINKKNSDDDDNTEESDHLKRIKQELLASLERVKQLAKKIYGDDRNKLKKEVQEKGKNERIKGGKNGDGTQTKEVTIEEKGDKERE